VIRTHDPGVWAGEDSSCLRPRGHCNRLIDSPEQPICRLQLVHHVIPFCYNSRNVTAVTITHCHFILTWIRLSQFVYLEFIATRNILILFSSDRLTMDGFWIGNWNYCTLCYSAWLHFTGHYYTHTLLSTVTFSLVVAWQRLPTVDPPLPLGSRNVSGFSYQLFTETAHNEWTSAVI
jgi:hypothetical protein